MAKGKYANLIGETVNGVKILKYERVPHTSKTGREYKVGRLTVAFETDTSKTLEISTDSWRKWSFIKRLTKLVKQVVKKVKQTFELMVITNTNKKQQQLTDMEVLRTTYSLKQLKQLYRKMANETHPDKGGNAKLFNEITTIYTYRKKVLKDTQDVVEELGLAGDEEMFAACVDLRVAMDEYMN